MKIRINKKFSKYLLPMHPVVLITTISKKSEDNAGVYATLIDISYNPPIVLFASNKFQHRMINNPIANTSPQDTYLNIKETKCFIVNVPSMSLINKLKIFAYPFPRGVDEIKIANLKKQKPFELTKNKIYPSIIKECLAHIECSLLKIINIKQSDHFLIVGKVVAVSYDSKLGKDFNKVRTNLIKKVFGNLGAFSKNERLMGRINPFKVKCPVYITDKILFNKNK